MTRTNASPDPLPKRTSPVGRAGWSVAFGTSVAVHLVVAPVLALVLSRSDARTLDPHPLDEMTVQTLFAAAPEPAAEVLQHVALPLPSTPQEAQRPDHARFADRVDRRVDVETVNRQDRLVTTAEETRNASPGLASPSETQLARVDRPPQQAPPPAPAARPPRPEAPDPTPPDAATPPDAPPPRPRDDSPGPEPRPPAPRQPPDSPSDTPPDSQPGTDPSPEPDGVGMAPVIGPTGVDLREFLPTPERTSELMGETARRNDYLVLEEGERTQLNSLRSLYWSFFDRMQDRLSQHWNPIGVLRVEDPGGLIHGYTARYTVLTVVLNGDGGLRHARVHRSSGVAALDQEAIRAFQVSAPFPNVPEGLKDTNGHVTFQFGFYVDFVQGSRRIRRLR